ncbi:MAG: DnaD domain protein [Clostridiaceae bacterium]|nr:DnaD domain protein [Clostridiaceae bacterium]
MQFECCRDILLSDTLIPDIFLGDIMPDLPSDAVKVYLYCIFLCKYKKKAEPQDLAAKLGLPLDSVKAAFVILEQEGLITFNSDVITITDIKEAELNKLYKRKTASDPENINSKTSANIKRIQCIESINARFFQGLMSPSWYTAIDNWFSAYRFDEDVMVSLFQYCYDNKALNMKYIEKVGATWHQKGITSHWELEKYLLGQEKIKKIGSKIRRILRLNRNLTEFEEEYIDTWINKYKFSMQIIEEALRKTAGKANPSFKYVHAILTAWHNDGIKNIEQLKAYLEAVPGPQSKTSGKKKVERRDNFQQRQYDDEFFEKLNQSNIN